LKLAYRFIAHFQQKEPVMNHSATPFQISDLRAEPRFLAIVGERLWQAWWKEDGYTLEDVLTLLNNSLRSEPIPTTWVAHAGEQFMGTVSLIVSDMDERMQYSPWLAALWVEAESRNQGIGAALLTAGMQWAKAEGVERVYLCAVEEKSAYYRRLGWEQIETGIGGMNIFTRASE
jgi:GNAT superfamily N-acetyltransferase